MNKRKLRFSQLPEDLKQEFFNEAASQAGPLTAALVVKEDEYISCGMSWMSSKRGWEFWNKVNDGVITQEEIDAPKAQTGWFADFDSNTVLYFRDGKSKFGFKPNGEWYKNTQFKNTNGFNELKKSQMAKYLEMEAKYLGLADGVLTKYGYITAAAEPEHEVLDNGDFYFHNILALKNGKWIKPKSVPGVRTQKEIDGAAIHALIKNMVARANLN